MNDTPFTRPPSTVRGAAAVAVLALGWLLSACASTATPPPTVASPVAAITRVLTTPDPTANPTVVLASSTPTRAPTHTPTVVPTQTPTATTPPTVTPQPTLTPVPTATPLPTVTQAPDAYTGLGIDDLASRSYGDGCAPGDPQNASCLRIQQVLNVTDAFTRTLIAYPSDGLNIVGFMNTPKGPGPFPVIVLLHGYVEPARYRTLTYTTRYADQLARAGYVVIHPNLRNFPPSDNGPDPFRTGLAIDVLNLLALVRLQGGQPGPLQLADSTRIGMWGHSMGGGVTQRVITVDPDAVQAAVLYGAMSGDEVKNYQAIQRWSGGQRGIAELDAPAEALQRIAPMYFRDRIQTPVSIHHGERDRTVPLAWSNELCDDLTAKGKTVECFTYPGLDHTFAGDGDRLFMQRVREFFDRYLRAAATPGTARMADLPRLRMCGMRPRCDLVRVTR